MHLVYLHGPPASGKFTIARALAPLIDAKVFHNHLTMDVAKALFSFDTEPFWQLVHQLRVESLRAAAAHLAGTVIYTSCYDHPADQPAFVELEGLVTSSGGELLPVYLQCATSELERRVSSTDRVAMGKLRTVDGLRDALSRWHLIAVPRDTCISIVTDGKTASQCADEIAAAFASYVKRGSRSSTS